ncbi:MAG: hypothetical protein ACD_10C00727G0003 [uncultured bacterium]|nr:MAG: hypothetical protein ACD_10C00727G0003 [uncultured bacterium]
MGKNLALRVEQRNVNDDGEFAIGANNAVGDYCFLALCGALKIGAVGQVVFF